MGTFVPPNLSSSGSGFSRGRRIVKNIGIVNFNCLLCFQWQGRLVKKQHVTNSKYYAGIETKTSGVLGKQ